ncbi:hypothetical protein EFY79_05435 [Hanamia caeni]|jgi:hypothetical protein|uniref:Uncharacterized protein n=1 Tax=Hanamia caeni TaxID=2294116 RepID=A0A3M9NMS2_9BACT|nr:hypothetical protein [Hanamia caeni]RNI39089.1 hypothetical protein EFY79_05435 [Hanamia caeni]
MKTKLFLLFATGLLVAFTPAKKASTEKSNAQPAPLIVHTFHKVETGSDAKSYYVTLAFNLSTQSFAAISAHENIVNPPGELNVTLTSGQATTLNGNGSTIDITMDLHLSIDGTSITIAIPQESGIPFDY